MSSKLRLSSIAAAIAAMLAIAPAASAATGPVQDPVPIGPNQYFSGLVNGSNGLSSPAVIQTDCLGPITVGETGHPLAGQSVEVQLAVPPVSAAGDVGYTGSAHSITAYLTWASPVVTGPELVATFTSYYVKEPIPVTLTVPCGGSGMMSFVPTPPTTTTGQAATVRVTFVGQP